MIDIHTHILPGVDDGVQTYDVALDALKYQLNSGVNHVVLTPHVNNVVQKVSSKEFLARFNAFKAQVATDLPKMHLYLGHEVRYHEHKPVDYENFIFQGFKQKYILIEFSPTSPDPVLDIIYNLTAKGFIPIIAHIERYSYLEPLDVHQLKSYGAIIQVNSGAVLGIDRKPYCKLAKKYLKLGLVDIIASDCHNMENRKPNLMESLEKAPKDFKMKELEV